MVFDSASFRREVRRKAGRTAATAAGADVVFVADENVNTLLDFAA